MTEHVDPRRLPDGRRSSPAAALRASRAHTLTLRARAMRAVDRASDLYARARALRAAVLHERGRLAELRGLAPRRLEGSPS